MPPVVPGTRGVQFFARLSDAGYELALHKGVDIFLSLDGEPARFDVGKDASEPGADGVCFLRGENAAFPEHRRMRNGRLDVGAPEFPVKRKRFVERVRVRRFGGIESALPEFHIGYRPCFVSCLLYNIFRVKATVFPANGRAARKFLDRTPAFAVQ